MSDLGTGTLLLRALSSTDAKTTSEIANAIRHDFLSSPLSDSDVFDLLLKAESRGFARRVKSDRFDETHPVTTTTWLLRENLTPSDMSLVEPERAEPYVKDAMIVVSQPIFLTIRGVNLRALDMPMLNVKEAMEKLVLDAKQELRIACPYYDELFIDILSSHALNVSKLRRVLVLAEAMDPILVKATKLFPNLKVRTLYKGATQSNNLKVQGIHAKLMIADQSEVLMGSFNFLFSHIYYNIDVGLFAKGEVARHYAQIFDLIWRSDV